MSIFQWLIISMWSGNNGTVHSTDYYVFVRWCCCCCCCLVFFKFIYFLLPISFLVLRIFFRGFWTYVGWWRRQRLQGYYCAHYYYDHENCVDTECVMKIIQNYKWSNKKQKRESNNFRRSSERAVNQEPKYESAPGLSRAGMRCNFVSQFKSRFCSALILIRH